MATNDCTMSINAGYLAEIKEDNKALRDILARLQQLCCKSSQRMDRETLSELLESLRDNVRHYFTLEETYGYMQEPLAFAPHLHHRTMTLRREHESLFRQVSDLADKARAPLNAWTRRTPTTEIVEQFRQLRRRLLAHEMAENELMCEAFHRDHGVAD